MAWPSDIKHDYVDSILIRFTIIMTFISLIHWTIDFCIFYSNRNSSLCLENNFHSFALKNIQKKTIWSNRCDADKKLVENMVISNVKWFYDWRLFRWITIVRHRMTSAVTHLLYTSEFFNNSLSCMENKLKIDLKLNLFYVMHEHTHNSKV